MIEDFIGHLGIPGILLIAFVIFVLVKGGKQNNNGGNSGSGSSTPPSAPPSSPPAPPTNDGSK